MKNQKNSTVQFNVNEVNFHPVLHDIENIFWFFILSNKALSHPDVQNILKQEKDGTILSMLKKYNKWVSLNIEIKNNGICTSRMNIKDEMIFIGKAMAILTYEFLSASKYKRAIEKWEEFRFLKYIRNAAAHDNKFDLKYRFGRNKGKWMINKGEIIKWNNKEISRKLQDTEVFNDFISLPSVFLLVKYFSERLTRIDNK